MRWAATNNLRRASLTRLRDGVARQVVRRPGSLTLPGRPWILHCDMNAHPENTPNRRWWWRHS